MKKRSRTVLAAVVLAVAMALFNSCERKQSAVPKNATEARPTLNNAMLLEITPMADGSAYAKSFTSGLWYLRSNKAVRVVLAESNSPEPFVFWEITPLLDGSAYATSLGTNSTIWYLHGDRAEKVNEVKSLGELGQLPQIPDKAFWTLYAHEREKRKKAEAHAESRSEYFPESPDDGRY